MMCLFFQIVTWFKDILNFEELQFLRIGLKDIVNGNGHGYVQLGIANRSILPGDDAFSIIYTQKLNMYYDNIFARNSH